MIYNAEVIVTLKEGIRDPEGTAIDTVLKRTGMELDSKVRVGKYFRFSVSAENDPEASEKLHKICTEVISNPILETYKIERFEKQ